MTTKKILIAGAGFLSALLLLLGCTKTNPDKITNEVTDFGNSTQFQVYNALVESSRNFFSADGKQLNGSPMVLGSSFPSTGYSSTFPSAGYNFVLSAGLHTFQVRDSGIATTQPQFVFSESFQANQYYTIFIYDTITAPKQKIVPTIIDHSDNKARVRFANFIYSSTPVPAVDIFSVKMNANIFTAVQRTDVTGFIPFEPGISDTLIVRSTGTTTALAQFNASIAVAKRSYTLVFRGRYAATAGTSARTLSAFTNY